MRALHILENTSQQFVAVQTAPSVRWLFLFFLAAALVGLLLSWRERFWRGVAVAGCLLVLFGLLAALPKPATYLLRIDVNGRVITSEGTLNGTLISSFAVNGSDLSAAELQSSREAADIVLVRQDGSLLFPLGEQKVQNEPDQYVVLTALRKAVHNAEGRGK